jgi:hypothetical protein
MRESIPYLRFQDTYDYERIKDLPYLNCFQAVLYRIADSSTKFPSRLARIYVYNLSSLCLLPSSIVRRIEEIRVLRVIDYHTQILLSFERLSILHISSSIYQKYIILGLPDSVEMLYISNIRIVRF